MILICGVVFGLVYRYALLKFNFLYIQGANRLWGRNVLGETTRGGNGLEAKCTGFCQITSLFYPRDMGFDALKHYFITHEVYVLKGVKLLCVCY